MDLLPVETHLHLEKTLSRSEARIIGHNGFFKAIQGQLVDGYEIHLGRSAVEQSLFEIIQQEDREVNTFDGASSNDGRIWGCHLHALFDNDAFRNAWLESMGVAPHCRSFRQTRQAAYDHLADVLESALDMEILERIITEGV